MSDPRLFLFEDRRAEAWIPFSPTRPVAELLHGCLLQRERTARALGVSCAGLIVGEALAGFDEDDSPGTVERGAVGTEGVRILVSSRVVLEADASDLTAPDQPARLTVDGETVGWALPDGASLPDARALATPEDAESPEAAIALPGSVLGWPWELIRANPDRIAADISALHPDDNSFLLSDVQTIGERHHVSMGEGVEVDPGLFFDLREGPVRLDRGVQVRGPARLSGPLYVGEDSLLLGGDIGASSFGPRCKVRGEVTESVILGYSNKAHDGHLGHAYLGRWVNLGAMTTNSDLKNSYSPVRVPLSPEGEVDTGLLKVGSFLGDHVKTGIGTLLDTGAVLGAGSNVFGGGLEPRYVPPFTWGDGGTYRLDDFFKVADRVVARREKELSPGVRKILERVWRASAAERS